MGELARRAIADCKEEEKRFNRDIQD